jgi:hypothetical protein
LACVLAAVAAGWRTVFLRLLVRVPPALPYSGLDGQGKISGFPGSLVAKSYANMFLFYSI